MYILAPHESLEGERAALSEMMERPVYIASTCHKHGTHYKKPNILQGEYGYIGRLELYLSQWTDHGLCVKRDGDQYYFDLHPATTLKLVFPILHGEYDEIYKKINCKPLFRGNSSFGTDTVYINVKEQIPNELVKYIQQRKTTTRVPARDAIIFMRSDYIWVPRIKQEKWHPGFRVTSKDPPFVTIQAPGWYNEEAIVSLEDINGFGLTDCDPGKCIICRGTSGERKHIGVVRGAYLQHHICKCCAKQTFNQWLELLDGHVEW
jgi:hypothetical protein